MNYFLRLYVFLLPLIFLAETSFSANKVALVIGNSSYQSAPLKNPANDASDLAEELNKLGFEVILETDASRRTMLRQIAKFGQNLRKATVGLFFFAGHGVQIDGINYLIPVNSFITDSSDLEIEGVDIRRVLGRMESAGTEVNLLFLDACRNNPFQRSFRNMNSGLAKMDAPKGTFITYATSPGKVADDGYGRNSPFTGELLNQINRPGEKIEDIIKNVRKGVLQLTDGKQMPWQSSSLIGDFYFIPPGASRTIVKKKITPQPEQRNSDFEILYWESIKNSNDIGLYNSYLDKYPNGHFAEIAHLNIRKLQDKLPKKEKPPAKKQYPTPEKNDVMKSFNDEQKKFAILPMKFRNEAQSYLKTITKELAVNLHSPPNSVIKSSSYDINSIDFKKNLSLQQKRVWKSGGFLRSTKPDTDSIHDLSKKLQSDYAILLEIDIDLSLPDKNMVQVEYLAGLTLHMVDIEQKKQFSVKKSYEVEDQLGILSDLKYELKSSLQQALNKLK